jgi:hypothetical protein
MKKIFVVLGVIVVILIAVFALRYFIPVSLQDSVTKALSEKYKQPQSDVTVTVINESGAFAKGSVNMKEGGGALWFAVKDASGWKLAYDGNGIIDCATANQYNFPAALIPTCLDTEHDNNLLQR